MKGGKGSVKKEAKKEQKRYYGRQFFSFCKISSFHGKLWIVLATFTSSHLTHLVKGGLRQLYPMTLEIHPSYCRLSLVTPKYCQGLEMFLHSFWLYLEFLNSPSGDGIIRRPQMIYTVFSTESMRVVFLFHPHFCIAFHLFFFTAQICIRVQTQEHIIILNILQQSC